MLKYLSLSSGRYRVPDDKTRPKEFKKDWMNIYVGNLSYDTTEEILREQFGVFGAIDAVKIITDRDTGRPRGFGFVEMTNDDEARAAIAAMDGKEIEGRVLKVNEARPRQERGDRGDRGDRGGGGGRRFSRR